jgi:hypothetical protein
VARIITFTTDWNNSDYYIGAVKASIISKLQDVVFVDISHNIESFSISQAAFILKSSFKGFPDGTIHIIGVDSEPDKNGKILIAKYRSQYFICNDNGCTGLIFDEKPEIVALTETGFAFEGSCFTELNLFADIAVYIAKNGDLSELGKIVDDVKRNAGLEAQIEPDMINGEVIYIDSYGNAITNITKEIYDDYVAGTQFEIVLNTNRFKAFEIHTSYKQVESGKIVCIFNSLGLLEIAVREGKANQLLNLNRKAAVRIRYKL